MLSLIGKFIPGANWLNLAAGALVGAALAIPPAYLVGRSDGATLAEVPTLKQTIKDIRERNDDDAETRKLSDFDLCVREYGSVPECDPLKLRGVREE